MTAVLAALLGGLLAISGGLVGIALTDRRERGRWLRDSQLQASTELVTALQLLIRRMINVAYLDPVESGSYELPDFEKRRPQSAHAIGVMAAFDDATAAWNSARHKALLITHPRSLGKSQSWIMRLIAYWILHMPGFGRVRSFDRNGLLLEEWPLIMLGLPVGSPDSQILNWCQFGAGTQVICL